MKQVYTSYVDFILTQVSVKFHYDNNVTEKLSVCSEKEQN